MQKVLALSFFPAFVPPSSGGEQRLYYFYRYLSERFRVTLLAPTYSHSDAETIRHGPQFTEVRVPKSRRVDEIHWLLDQSRIGPECSGLAFALAGSDACAYAEKLAALAADADVIVHDSPFSVPYDRGIGTDGVPRIYNSYNVETALAGQLFGGERAAAARAFVARVEGLLAREANHIFAVSAEECDAFVQQHGVRPEAVTLAPNGFEPTGDDPEHDASEDEGAPVAVFMGSQHPPNIEAATFIIEALAHQLPDVDFVLFGSVCDKLADVARTSNVRLLGRVDEPTKNRLIRKATFALNPMFSGAGSNLKMLDYLANGACVITTPIGARGLRISNEEHAFIVPASEFASAMSRLRSDAPLRVAVRRRAKKIAHEHYSWKTIVGETMPHFERVIAGVGSVGHFGRKPKLLVINDYAIADGTGGGQRRLRELLVGMSSDMRIDLLCLGEDGVSVRRTVGRDVIENVVPKTPEHRRHEQAANGLSPVSVSDILAGMHCLENKQLVDAFERLSEAADVVILEHPYLSPLLERLAPDKLVVYSSQNVERDLKGKLLSSRPDVDEMTARVRALEDLACTRAALLVCVSDDDARRFEALFPDRPTFVVPNGVTPPVFGDVPATSFGSGTRPNAIFVGSAHMPNVEAASFIIDVCAPRCPTVDFALVGQCCDAFVGRGIPPNVVLHGRVSELDKNLLIRNAAVGINPMFSGGGSSLKMPEMMAFGIPVVSTEIGARGYGFVPGLHYVPSSADDFAATVTSLLSEPIRARRIAVEARRFVRDRYTWNRLARDYAGRLRAMLAQHGMKKRLLAVTFRYSEPTKGGAESFLRNVLERIASRADYSVDLAAFACDEIRNRYHFSATYEAKAGARATPAFARHVEWFDAVPPDDATLLANARAMNALWASESTVRARELLTSVPELGATTILLGGWNLPERSPDGTMARWTTRVAEIALPAGTVAMRCKGYAPLPQCIGVSVGDGDAATQEIPVSGAFEFSRSFATASGDVILRLACETTFETPGDARQLGVRIEALDVRQSDGFVAVDLSGDIDAAARASAPDRLIETLIAATERRDPSTADLFIDTRGPWSDRMGSWLDEHVSDYDVVLAHGTPFRPIVEAQRAASRGDVPVIVLPHFHAEDPYYHWQEFYDAFRKASCLIAAPATSKEHFFDRIGAPAISMAGGGIDPLEFEEERLARARQAWQAASAVDGPFVLVLGRKAGAKNYRAAIRAVALARAEVPDLKLVMIGPDDDGTPVTGDGVVYLGLQPRETVLGALASCLCLANMSTSESFGIVVLEAWLAHAPVVVERSTPAFSELVVDGEHGILVSGAEELASAIVALYRDPVLRDRLAANGARRAQGYSWDALADQLAAVADGLIRRPAN